MRFALKDEEVIVKEGRTQKWGLYDARKAFDRRGGWMVLSLALRDISNNVGKVYLRRSRLWCDTQAAFSLTDTLIKRKMKSLI